MKNDEPPQSDHSYTNNDNKKEGAFMEFFHLSSLLVDTPSV